jgi:hypothetical protein
MRRTNVMDLAVPFVVIASLVYLVLRSTYQSLPPFQWFIAVPIAILAIVEFVIARRVLNAVRHEATAKPMKALAIARAVALGKASALVGAAMGGAATSLVLRVLPDANRAVATAHDLKVGLAVLVVSSALCAAGLRLERAGIAPRADG